MSTLKINDSGRSVEAVILQGDESAAVHTCGSCKHYRRSDYGTGWCAIEFPPMVNWMYANTPSRIKDDESNPRYTKDSSTCAFWTASGLTYIRLSERFTVK